MSIVLDAKDNKETGEIKEHVKDFKAENQVGSIGSVGSTVIGSNGAGSAGNVGSIGNVPSLGNVASLGNVGGSLGNVDDKPSNIGSVGNAGSVVNLIEPANLAMSSNTLSLGQSSAALINAVSTSSVALAEKPEAPVVYREYAYRFVIMALYACVTNAGNVTGGSCAPIITNLQNIYGISQTTVNLATLLGMILYIPATIPGNWIMDTYGIKKGLWLGSALQLVGIWVRMLAGQSFGFVLLGQALAALGSPLICNCPQKISAYWTAPRSRTMFTTILMLSGVVGGSVGSLLPGYIVGEENDPVLGKALFLRLLLIQAIIGTILTVPIFIFFRERPPSPPSASASIPRESFRKGVKLLVRNRNFLWLLAQQGCILGCINSLATVLQALIFPFGYDQKQAANLGVILNVSSVVGCLLIGIYVEKTKRFRISIILSSIIGLCAYGLFIGVLYLDNFAALAICVGILGFVMAPSGPLALEFGCEITFPVGEATSGGVILSIIQIFCPVQTFALGGIMEMEDQRKAALYCIIMLIGFMIVGFGCSLKLKQTLVRSTHDKMHADKAKAAAIAAAEVKDGEVNPETPCPMVDKAENNSPSPKNEAENASEPVIAL